MSSEMISIILTFTGITGVFLFFRIEGLTDILVGDGRSVLERESKESMGQKQWKRLRDAVYRKNIYGIYEGLLWVTIKEKEETKKPGETGYSNYVLETFEGTKKFLNRLKCFLLGIIILSICSIAIILICDNESLQVITTISFSIVTFLVVLYSICFKAPHEKNKKEECDKLREELEKAT